jgi:non-ribosomal peptide synthetase component F
MLGPFMNTLPLLIDVSNEPAMPELVRRVKDVSLAAMAHQDAPFHDVMAALLVDHGPEARSAGEVALVMEDPGPQDVVFGGLTLSRAPSAHLMARRELTLSIAAADGEITGTLIYDRDLFSITTAQGLANEFEAVLASVREAHA